MKKPSNESQERAKLVLADPDASEHDRTMAELVLKRHAVTRRFAASPVGPDCCHERAKKRLGKTALEMKLQREAS